MKLTAVFENWHIGDGNYPPLHRGQLVSLSFELEPRSLEETSEDKPEEFSDRGDAEYRFCGRVLKVYENEGDGVITIVESAGFRFYVLLHDSTRYAPATRVAGRGTLLLDHYIWVEFLDEYADPPNLFYNLRVSRIRKVQTPEQFITRHDKGNAMPTRLAPNDYSEADVEELETMDGQSFSEEFYIIDFDNEGLGHEFISRTFIG